MTNKKNRITIAILGFFVLAIPLLFLSYNINREFLFSKDRITGALREKLLDSASKVEEKLDPFNYIKSEFEKIHVQIFPDAPNEVIDQIPEDSFIKNLYSKEKYNKLLNLTKERFAPIITIFGTNNISNIYYECCQELKNSFKEVLIIKREEITKENLTKEEKYLLDSKNYFDVDVIIKKYHKYFLVEKNGIPNFNYILKNKEEYNNKKKSGIREFFSNTCYTYLSRFCDYKNNNIPIYTDYFNKQVLYPVLKFTISKKGIHGFYSLLIPESHIEPKSVLDSALLKQDSGVKIELVDNKKSSEIKKEDNNLSYRLNFPTTFINLVNNYKNLNEIDQSHILQKQIKLSIDYPKEFYVLQRVNKYTYLLYFLIFIIYVFISFFYVNNSIFISFNLTKKIILLLCIIILLPNLGIGIFSLIISHNLGNFIDLNVKKDLSNQLENYSLFDEENQVRRFANVLELKKVDYDLIKKNDKANKTFTNKWQLFHRNYSSNLYIFSDKGDLDFFDRKGLDNEKKSKKGNEYKFTRIIFYKYLRNFNFLKSNIENKVETFTFSVLEDYLDFKAEAKSFSQESIPLKGIINPKELDSASFFYTNDSKYIGYNTISGKNNSSYNFLYHYFKKYPSWNNPKIRNTSFTNLCLTLRNTSDNDVIFQYPASSIYDKDFINLINQIHEQRDSGNEIIKKSNGSIIKEWMFNEETPFIIMGITESNTNNMLNYMNYMIFPLLFTYGIFLLLILSSFISHFINKPISIYQEAIEKLRNNQFDTTITSFSKDEFNYITDAFNEMSIAIKQKEQMKRYVSDRLVQSVEDNDVQEAGDGKQERVTILSSDIRNFTGTSEKYEPSEIVEMLNSYFTKMQKAISDNGGIIDKYIGDAIQAVFYDDPDKENQVIRASKAALAMRKALIEFNEERKSKGLFTIENGIGIDTDFAITGTIGTQNGRKDFSVNGDVIARAADLEAKTKKTTSKILLSKKSLEEITHHPSPTTNHSEAQASQTPIPSSLSPKIMDCHENKTICKDYLVYKDFDNDSVELLDVRE